MADLSHTRNAPTIIASTAMRVLPAAARFTLRGAPAVLQAAGNALGIAIATTACRSARAGTRAALWLGPDEQLLLAEPADGAAIQQQLLVALASLPHALVDVSHRQLALEVAGPMARNILNAGCPLDLDGEFFPVGMCTRTVLGKAEIVLWRTATETFHVEVWRSFAEYATRFLAEASRELAG